jgi:hypothetical protein
VTLAERRYWTPRMVVALVVVVAGAMLVQTYLRRRAEAIETAKVWEIAGPPCPRLTPAAFVASGHNPRKLFEFDGVTIARLSGHVDCQAVTYEAGRGFGTYPVCQMTSPTALRVTTKKGEFHFVPGSGSPATVSAPRGEARCVLASNFTLR